MLFILFSVSMFFQASANSMAEETFSPGEQKILEEIKSLKKAVEAIEKRLTTIEKMIEDQENEPATPPTFFPGSFRKEAPGKLKGISLQDDPTKEQVREYVRKIKDASEGQNYFSSGDPQIELLLRVPHEHLDVLFDEAQGRFPGVLNYHVVEALKQLVTEEDIPRIREALSLHKELITLIESKGWEKEVEDVLLREMESGEPYLPPAWISAVARLRNPVIYPALLDYLLKGGNPHMTLEAIESIPDFPQAEFEEVVGRLWEKKKSGDGQRHFGPPMEYEKVAVAKAAAKFGHVDALEYCIRRLNEKGSSLDINDQNLRPFVLRLVPVLLTNKELLRWSEENADKLVFNRKTGKYEMKGEKKEEGF